MLITIPENARQDAFYRLFNPAVRFKTVGYVDKSHIDRHSHLRRDKRATVEAVGLAHTTARRHTVNGMADAFLKRRSTAIFAHNLWFFPNENCFITGGYWVNAERLTQTIRRGSHIRCVPSGKGLKRL